MSFSRGPPLNKETERYRSLKQTAQIAENTAPLAPWDAGQLDFSADRPFDAAQMTPRNIALIAAGGAALLAIGFLSGRRVEADGAGKAGLTNVSSQPLVPASGGAAPTSSAPKPASSNPPPDKVTGVGDLFERLEKERATRPKLEPTSEKVFAAVKEKAGVEVEEQLQVAGWVIGAKFCDKIRTTKDVHIVVCEFATEADAITGQKNASNAISRREVLRNKTTTCAVHQAGEGEGAATQAARVKELFKAL